MTIYFVYLHQHHEREGARTEERAYAGTTLFAHAGTHIRIVMEEATDKFICRFPDGKGGFISKIMGDDGLWHVCDEDGNITDGLQCESDLPPREKNQREPNNVKVSSSPRKRNPGLHIQASEDEVQKINNYLMWSSMREGHRVKLNDFFLKLASNHIRRDSEYQDFLKKIQ